MKQNNDLRNKTTELEDVITHLEKVKEKKITNSKATKNDLIRLISI